jgi:hypothetical protein
MSKIEITYYLHGSRFTEQFTAEQAKEALINYGYPKAVKLTNEEALTIYNNLFNEQD